ncbi:MAG TPA: SDR family oxidoreductase [Noviherbaspirillum sp.]|uniref:SDR family oxidoreductase n=1 Tax=Noviherbaspirillum sp. TaxID=1926288 RepID=UPI002DDD0EC3|nr:SDR family oxidoreductase [Noviherbaspirillum sp.]HEV2611833.1 SDR family oxidoreductase [Noviherbaspirillum sp.]
MKAILTGHTRGLGAAIAENLLARNIPVLGLARATNDALGQRFPSLLEQHAVDLSDTAALSQWLAGDAMRRFLAGGDTVLLINNAGIVQPVGPLPAQDPATIARAVALNVAAPLMLAGAVAAAGMRDTRILHISSGAARNAYPGWSVYCATKAALDHHARAATLDQVPGLRIASLAPGVIDTDMQADIRATPLERFPIRERFDELKRSGALTSPAECAVRLVAYLLGEGFGQDAVMDLRVLAG